MKTINPNSTGNQFIQDINDNFAECISGGGDGSVPVKVPLQGGELKSATGYVDGRWCAAGASNGVGTWTDDDFYKYLHSPCYLSLKGNNVKSVTTPSGSTLTIFCYDETFTLISGGAVSAVENIPDGTAFVKFMLYDSSGYSQVGALEITLAAQPEWVKNTGTSYTPQWFNFDCRPPKMWDTDYTVAHSLPTDGSADAGTTRYHDNGCVILPPNYSPVGTPCKVVLWFNGDNCAWFIMHDPYKQANGNTSAYEQNFKYFLAQGFAVVMCTGYTSMWKDEDSATNAGLWMSRVSPAYIASVRALYDHIMRNYNFDPAVYLGAKSAGGSMLLHTAITRPFPVRAAAGISVLVSAFDTMRYSYVATQKTWQKRFGCTNWNDFTLSQRHGSSATIITSSGQSTEAGRLVANKDIYRKYDAFGMNSDIDWDAFVTQCLALSSPFNNGADYPSALTDVIFEATKVVNTPLKYWCATKDAAVPYTWHKIMVEWITRNGGIAELRSYTGSDGSHFTFAGEGNKTATVATQYGGSRTASIGFIEAMEWFKRW